MGKYALKLKTWNGGDEQFYTGSKYYQGNRLIADTDIKSYAKSFKTYAAARERCHELNSKCYNGDFTVISI